MGLPKENCSCRCRACSPNTSVRRSWSAVGVVSDTPRPVAVSTSCPVLRTAIAMWLAAKAGAKRLTKVDEEQATVVKQIFQWVGRDRLSIGEVTRRLTMQGIRSAKGKPWWDRTSVWGILKNSAYCGAAAFGKTRVGPRRTDFHSSRRASKTRRRAGSIYDTAAAEQISIPVVSSRAKPASDSRVKIGRRATAPQLLSGGDSLRSSGKRTRDLRIRFSADPGYASCAIAESHGLLSLTPWAGRSRSTAGPGSADPIRGRSDRRRLSACRR